MDEFFGEDSNHLFDNYIPNLSESSIPFQQTPMSGYLESVVAKATAFPTKKAKAVDEFCGGERRGSVTVVDWSDFSPGPVREAAPTLTDPGAAMNLSPEVRYRSAPTTADRVNNCFNKERAQNRNKIKKAQYEKRRRAKIGDRLKSLHHTLAPNSTTMEKITMLKETGEKYEEVEKEAEMTKTSGDDELSIGQQLELYVVASDELSEGTLLHPSVFLQPPFSSSPPTQNKLSICSALSAAVLARPEKMEVYTQMAAYLHKFQQNRAGPSTTDQNN